MRIFLFLLFLTFSFACGGDSGSATPDGGDDTCPTCEDQCKAAGADLVYALDYDYNLLSFDPEASANGEEGYTELGRVACRLAGPLPGLSEVWAYSLTSDRNGNVWIFYTSGEIFKIDVATMACTETGWQDAGNLKLVQMAFGGSDPANERLFMALNPVDSMSPAGYAEVNPSTFQIGEEHIFADQTGYVPNLAGSSDGSMLGFRPVETAGEVTLMDLETGAVLEEWAVPDHGKDSVTFFGSAIWKGQSILFTTKENSIGGRTHKIASFDRRKPIAEQLTILAADSPRGIRLAGSSTCAPPWTQD